MKDYNFKINGHDYTVVIDDISATTATVTVNGTPYTVDIPSLTASGLPAATEGPKNRGNGPSAAQAAPSATQGHNKTVKSPLPGMIIGLKVGRGQAVKRGDKIAVLEAMKMENDILAPVDGTVTNVYVSKGDAVLEGAKIADIE